ncbi:hypothetical protein HID58_044067, partial [Brassica napus]
TFRSSGVKKSLKDETMERLKAMGSAPIEEGGGKSTPSAGQAFLGAVSAGVRAQSLGKSQYRKDYHQRICYLATFVFSINAVGLLLYSGQLAFSEESVKAMQATTEPGGDSSGDNSEVNKSSEDQSSGD